MTQATFGRRGVAAPGPRRFKPRRKEQETSEPQAPSGFYHETAVSEETVEWPKLRTIDRHVSIVEAMVLGFANYFNFQGRSSRGAYWNWVLFTLLTAFCIGFADAFMFQGSASTPLSHLFSIITLVPSLALAVRRLHDVNKSGWWVLIALTLIGGFLLLYWYRKPGDRSANLYGDDVEAGR